MPRRRFASRTEPARCKCVHTVDTPEWSNKRGRHAGMTTRGAAFHGDPFRHKPGCIHSELAGTVRATPKRRTVKRVRLQ